tara:strand:- start:368 stop:1516 length:1149 start_codon:yes stop_codon:yes gene_type:complete
MATTFKTLLNNDRTSTRTLLHEAIPITGSILSGTYSEPGSAGSNIKQHAHGMFHSVYDYPYLSSSANHIFDLTCGFHSDSVFYTQAAAATSSDYSKKKNIYNQMAQVLMGHTTAGVIQKFDADGNLTPAAGATDLKYTDVFFMNFARLLGKDEIKKGSFELQLGISGSITEPFGKVLTIKDDGAATSYLVNSPAGEYGILKVTADGAADGGLIEDHASYSASCGLLFYQAGVAVLSKDAFTVFHQSTNTSGSICSGSAESTLAMDVSSTTMDTLMRTGTINSLNTAFRHRVKKVSFNNTTELNSTIYFCRVNANEFNYSSNPTYLTGSQIRVKRVSTDAPVSYFTTVGLYSADNELLAVAKLSEPLRKDPTSDMTVRVRLDY